MGTIKEKENSFLDFNIEKIFDIKKILFIGQKLIFKYWVAIKDGKAINQIIINSNLGSFKFGNDGVDTETSNTWIRKTRIFTSRFPLVPTVTLGIIANGSLECSVKYANDSKDSLQMSLSGDLKSIVEVISGPDGIAKIFAGADGTIISASGFATVTKNDVIQEFKFYGTTVSTWVEAWYKIPVIGDKILWGKTFKLFNSWFF